jgi:hypothetical protein
MLKRTLVLLIAVLIVLAVTGMLLPRNIPVERSVAVARPASLIADRNLLAHSLSACARECRLAQQMLGGPADTIGLDGRGEFETHAHRLGDLG